MTPSKKAFEHSHIPHRASQIFFMSWVFGIHVRRIAEIGVDKGQTSQQLRAFFPDAHLYLIDPWQLTPQYLHSATPISRKEKYYEKSYASVSQHFAHDTHVTLLRMTGMQASATLDEEFDIVFIDANHEYKQVKEHILAWLPKIRAGGMLCGHDYTEEIAMFSGVKRAVDETFGSQPHFGKDRTWFVKK